jgi:hypothetical protein
LSSFGRSIRAAATVTLGKQVTDERFTEVVMGDLALDYAAWEEHAGWWDQEAGAARERMDVDEATIAAAHQAFGKIGSSTVGASYAAALEARRALGLRLGAYADNVAAHIRRDLQTYADGEAAGAGTLST